MIDPSRIRVVKQYLLHESKKQATLKHKKDEVARTMPERHAKAYAEFVELPISEVQQFLDQLSAEDLYVLFHSVSEGAFAKELWNCVASPKVKWDHELCLVTKLVFESPVGVLRHRFDGSPRIPLDLVLEYLRELPKEKVESAMKIYGSESETPRSADSLIGTAFGLNVVIHDGNGRLLRICSEHVMEGTDLGSLAIWVGRQRQASGSELQWISESSARLFPKRS